VDVFPHRSVGSSRATLPGAEQAKGRAFGDATIAAWLASLLIPALEADIAGSGPNL
jgi:hypothetical protein